MLRDVIAERDGAEWVSLFRENDINVALVAEFPDPPNDPKILANDMAPLAPDDMEMARIVRDPINVEGVGRATN